MTVNWINKLMPSSAAAIAMLASSATTALAQDPAAMPQDELTRLPVGKRPHSDFEPLGIRWNSMFFYPSVKTQSMYDSNVFATPNDAQDDFALIVSPGLVARSDTPTASYQTDIGADIYKYHTFSSQDRVDAHARVRTRNEVTRDLIFETSLEAARRHEIPGDLTAPTDTKDPVPYNDLHADAILTRNFDRFGIGVGAGVRNLTYEGVESLTDGFLDQSFRDGTILTATLKPTYEFSPGYRIYSRLRANTSNYAAEGDSNRDSEGYDGRGGLEFPLTPLIFGSVEAGYLSQSYENPLIEPVHGLSGGTKLTWLATPLMTVSLAADRSIAETVTQDIEGRIDTVGSLKVDYELLRNLIISAGAEYANQDYEGIPRVDEVTKLSIGFEYLMNRTIEIDAQYNFVDRSSTDALESFDAHVVMFNVTAQR